MVLHKRRCFSTLLALPLFLVYFQFAKVAEWFASLEETEVDLFSPQNRSRTTPSFLQDVVTSAERLALQKTNDSPRETIQHGVQQTISSGRAEISTADSTSKKEKVIVLTFAFGEQTAAKGALRIFIESCRNAGFDFGVIGDTPLPYALPDNVHYLHITWEGFVERAFQKIRNGTVTTKLIRANFRKLCDFTPVMGFLFPELVEGYDWWGHIDSDMMVGNMSKFIPQELLQNHDIISGHNKQPAWGPFTLFRNTKVVNELFLLCPQPLEKNLLNQGNAYFDEWGNNNRAARFNFSIAGIITNEAPRLGLRVAINVIDGILWDKTECLYKYKGDDNLIPPWCMECIYDKGTLTLGRTGEEILCCHYHASKKRPQHEESVKDKGKLEDLAKAQQFRSGWQEGFDYFDSPEQQELKARRERLNRESLPPAAESSKAVIATQSTETTIQSPRSSADAFYDYHYQSIHALVNLSSVLDWQPRGSDPFGPLYNELGYVYRANGIQEPDLDLKASKYIFWGSICAAAKAFTKQRQTEGAEPIPHVLFFRMNENWGGFSEAIPDKTAEWVRDLTQAWKKEGCTKEFIFDYLDHPDTLQAFTVQFQVFDHPKVHSLPLGIKSIGQAKIILQRLEEGKVERTQLLMVNSKSRVMRDAAVEKVIENFNGTISNTYGKGAESFENFYRELKRSKFILSPGGLGFDCYRHWEALYIGTIPVLETLNRTDGWMRTLDDLPVAWIDTYDNLSPEWLEKEYIRITNTPQRYNYGKLTKNYWINFIKSFVPGENQGINGMVKTEPSETIGSLAENSDKVAQNPVEPSTNGGTKSREELEQTFYQDHFDNLHNLAPTDMLVWGARKQIYGYSCKFFLDRFPYKWLDEKETNIAEKVKESPFVWAKRSLCHAAKAFRAHQSKEGAEPLPHILLFRFHEDFGGFSMSVPEHTKKNHNLTTEWYNEGCSVEFIWEYLDHPDLIAAFTNQFQSFYHPKVYSIPIGNRGESNAKHIHRDLNKHSDKPWTFKNQMLLINSKPRAQRVKIINGTIDRFAEKGIFLENTYSKNDGFKYFRLLSESRFILSPSGSGWDCYRHYEGMYLGAIPIVNHVNRTDGWRRSLDNLPVAWIDTYDKLTPEWLENEYQRILEQQDTINYKKLSNQWWIDFVYSHLYNSLAREDPARYWMEVSKPGGLAEGFEAEYFKNHPEHLQLRQSNID